MFLSFPCSYSIIHTSQKRSKRKISTYEVKITQFRWWNLSPLSASKTSFRFAPSPKRGGGGNSPPFRPYTPSFSSAAIRRQVQNTSPACTSSSIGG